MIDHILSNVICSEFERTFGRDSEAAKAQELRSLSDPNNAMQLEFSLHVEHNKEDGYRNLKLLIFGRGSNYIGVYGKLDWNVVSDTSGLGISWDKEDADANPEPHYVKGETPWVLLGCHDSCWRDSVQRLLFLYRDRLGSLRYLGNGSTRWFKSVPLTNEEKRELNNLIKDRDRAEFTPKTLEELAFQFEEAPIA